MSETFEKHLDQLLEILTKKGAKIEEFMELNTDPVDKDFIKTQVNNLEIESMIKMFKLAKDNYQKFKDTKYFQKSFSNHPIYGETHSISLLFKLLSFEDPILSCFRSRDGIKWFAAPRELFSIQNFVNVAFGLVEDKKYSEAKKHVFHQADKSEIDRIPDEAMKEILQLFKGVSSMFDSDKMEIFQYVTFQNHYKYGPIFYVVLKTDSEQISLSSLDKCNWSLILRSESLSVKIYFENFIKELKEKPFLEALKKFTLPDKWVELNKGFFQKVEKLGENHYKDLLISLLEKQSSIEDNSWTSQGNTSIKEYNVKHDDIDYKFRHLSFKPYGEFNLESSNFFD